MHRNFLLHPKRTSIKELSISLEIRWIYSLPIQRSNTESMTLLPTEHVTHMVSYLVPVSFGLFLLEPRSDLIWGTKYHSCYQKKKPKPLYKA